MLIQENFTKTGLINKPHGVKGELNIAFNTDWMDEDEQYDFLFIQKEGYLVPYKVEELFIISDDKGYVKFEDVDNNEDAALLTGSAFYLPNELLEDINPSRYDELLIGFRILNSNNNKVGTVTAFLDIPNNPVIEVQTQTELVLLPFHESLIINFDQENKTIILEIADGLIESNTI